MVVLGGVIIQALVAELVSRRPLASSKVVQELEVEGVTCRWRWRMTSRVCVCGGVGGTRLNFFLFVTDFQYRDCQKHVSASTQTQ